MPRGLIGMTCCGGVVFRARTRCGHVSSELEMLLAATWAKEDFSPSDSRAAGSETTHAQRTALGWTGFACSLRCVISWSKEFLAPARGGVRDWKGSEKFSRCARFIAADNIRCFSAFARGCG